MTRVVMMGRRMKMSDMLTGLIPGFLLAAPLEVLRFFERPGFP